MKKKQYILPQIEVHTITPTAMLNGSKVFNGSMPPGSQMSKEREMMDEWDDLDIIW
jgi:hypothetical protein